MAELDGQLIYGLRVRTGRVDDDVAAIAPTDPDVRD